MLSARYTGQKVSFIGIDICACIVTHLCDISGGGDVGMQIYRAIRRRSLRDSCVFVHELDRVIIENTQFPRGGGTIRARVISLVRL